MPLNPQRALKLKTDAGTLVDQAYPAHFYHAAPGALNAAGILALTALGAALQNISAGITDPDVPRALSIVANLAGVTGNVIITGKNYAGEAITETIALNGVTTVNGTKAFKEVDSIQLPAQSHTPAKQVETIAVTAACTQAGYLKITVTAANMPNSPKDVWVAVDTDDSTTALVAAAIRAALTADTDVGGFFTVGGADANIILTAKDYAANDGTMAIALTDTPATGVTIGASTDTRAGVLGVAQVETITVTAGATQAGTLVFRVTAAGMTGTPKDVNVAVTLDDNEAAEVATKIRAALTADADVGGFFTVSGSGADVVITAKTKAANDGTMAMALQSADSTGVTVGASGNTTAGVAPVTQIETISVTHKADLKGTIVIAVTAANMTNSPKSVNVSVDENDSTVNLVAAKIRAALTADADVGAFFTVSGSDAEVNLTAKTDAANDATMAMALTDAPASGVTVGASQNTTAGVALDKVSVGRNDVLGLPFKLSRNTVIPGMTYLNNTKEGTDPTVTVSATALESNTMKLNSALDGNRVDTYLLV